MKRGWVVLVSCALLAGCGDDAGSAGGGSSSSSGEAPSTGPAPSSTSADGSSSTTTGVDASSSSSSSDTGETDTTGEPPSEFCEDGLRRTAWVDATRGGYDLPAQDFSIETLRGPVTFSETWTGCDNYVFVLYNPANGGVNTFWDSSIDDLVEDSAPNTVYFFVAVGLEADVREMFVSAVGSRIENKLEELGQETYDAWSERFRYVLSDGNDMPVVVDALAQVPGEAHFTVDRMQLVREGHNVALFNGSWVPQLSQVRFWSKYWHAQYRLDAELATQAREEDVLVHRIADAQEIMGGADPVVFEFPDAETIANYDTLHIDMHVDCPGEGHPYGTACGEWDVVGGLWLCRDEDCTPENRRRVVKWITPYSSPGRWLIDITPELVHLQEGGSLRFMTTGGDNNVGAYTYKYTMDLRFGLAEDGLHPFAIQELVPRGNYGWNDSFHDQWNTFELDPPEGAVKAELYTRISGHGAVDGTSCGEFCSFTHSFDVNGTPFAHTYVMENTVDRCAMLVEEGVTPNQGGTWFFDRSSWCPGWTIEEWREDITAAVDLTKAGSNTVLYTSEYASTGAPGGGNMDMRVEVVYYQ